MIAPTACYSTDKLVLTIREFFSHHPEASHCGMETLVELLYARHFLRYRPAVSRVEAALEVLNVERSGA